MNFFKKNIRLCFGFFLLSFLFSNSNTDLIITEQLRKIVFQKIYNQIVNYKDISRESDDAFLGESMTNVSSSAPREEFIINVDIGDSLLYGDVNLIAHISTDNQESWNHYNGYALNEEAYNNTWEAIASLEGDEVSWYLTGEVDSETIFDQPEWGTLLFTQLPFNESDVFPIISSVSQTLGYPEINDTSQACVDITAIEASYNNDNLYFHLEYGANLTPSEGPLGPWHIYVMGVQNPVSETGYAYAYVFDSASLLGISPGIYELYDGNYSLLSYDDLPYVGIPFLNKLDIKISLDALFNRPDFGPWPNSSNSLIAIGQTFDIIPDFEDINNSGTVDRDIIRSTILLDSYYQNSNNNVQISNGIVDVINQEMKIKYFDLDGNFPIIKEVQICSYMHDVCDLTLEMLPETHDYKDTVEFYINYDFTLLPTDEYAAKFIFSDDSLDNADWEIVYFSVSDNQIGDVNLDLVIDVLDIILIIDIILEFYNPSDIQIILADFNNDLLIDVLDILMIIDIILG